MTNIVSQHGTVEEMTEVLISWNVIRNPGSSKEQKEEAQARIAEIREVVATRLNITINKNWFSIIIYLYHNFIVSVKYLIKNKIIT